MNWKERPSYTYLRLFNSMFYLIKSELSSAINIKSNKGMKCFRWRRNEMDEMDKSSSK